MKPSITKRDAGVFGGGMVAGGLLYALGHWYYRKRKARKGEKADRKAS